MDDTLPLSIADLLRESKRLGDRSDTPRLDIELLLAQVIDKPRSWIIAYPEFVLSQEMSADFIRLFGLRLKGEPIAYLLGSKEFWSLDFKVTHNTLIPRPETELVVETVLALFDDEPRTFVDLGTGSGAIAIAIKHERKNWTGFATDTSLAALKVASSNSCHLKTEVSLICGDWCSPLNPHSFDLVVSNPPYIEGCDLHLQALHSEPRSALVAQHKGLSDLFTIIRTGRQLIKPGGYLVLEHGYDQGDVVCDKLEQEGYSDIHCLKDFNDLPRVCVGQSL